MSFPVKITSKEFSGFWKPLPLKHVFSKPLSTILIFVSLNNVIAQYKFLFLMCQDVLIFTFPDWLLRKWSDRKSSRQEPAFELSSTWWFVRRICSYGNDRLNDHKARRQFEMRPQSHDSFKPCFLFHWFFAVFYHFVVIFVALCRLIKLTQKHLLYYSFLHVPLYRTRTFFVSKSMGLTFSMNNVHWTFVYLTIRVSFWFYSV